MERDLRAARVSYHGKALVWCRPATLLHFLLWAAVLALFLLLARVWPDAGAGGRVRAHLPRLVRLAEHVDPNKAREMLEYAKHVMNDQKTLDAMTEAAFHDGDQDGSGFIEQAELADLVAAVCGQLGIRHPDSPEREALMEEYDVAGNGKLSQAELKPFIIKSLGDLMIVLKEKVDQSIVQRIQNVVDESAKSMTKTVFEESDKDKSGFVEEREFHMLMVDLAKDLGIDNTTQEERESMLASLDKAGDHRLSEEELEPLVKVLMEDLLEETRQQLSLDAIDAVRSVLNDKERLEAATQECFTQADKDKSGFIEERELHFIMRGMAAALGMESPLEGDCKDMMRQLNIAQNGKLSKEELLPFVKQASEMVIHQIESTMRST